MTKFQAWLRVEGWVRGSVLWGVKELCFVVVVFWGEGGGGGVLHDLIM